MKQLKLFILGLVIILVAFAWYFTRLHEASGGPAEVGKPAPEFSLQDARGQTVRLSDFRGKIVVLNFWATWCPPCLQEAPSLDQFYCHYLQSSSRQLVVLTVSVDSGWEPVQQFSLEKKITFPVLLDTHQTVPHLYGTFKYPETYIIDARGIVREKVIGGYNWMSPEVLRYFDSLLQQ